MSERTTVEVACPLNRVEMTGAEALATMGAARDKCRELIGPLGRILGVIPPPRLEAHPLTDQPTLIITFAVQVPESVQLAANN